MPKHETKRWWTVWSSNHIVTLSDVRWVRPKSRVRSKFSGQLEIWPLQKQKSSFALLLFTPWHWQTPTKCFGLQIYSDILLGLATSIIEFMVHVKFAKLTFHGIFVVNIYQMQKSAVWIFNRPQISELLPGCFCIWFSQQILHDDWRGRQQGPKNWPH